MQRCHSSGGAGCASGVRPNRILILGLLATISVTAALGQMQAPPAKPHLETGNTPVWRWTDAEKNIWAAAKPYLDDPLPELERAVPNLKGLAPATRQEQLAFILDHAGNSCVNLLERMPNLISTEEVVSDVNYKELQVQTFEYLLLSRRADSGVILEEYRNEKWGGPSEQNSNSLFSEGFASMWVLFFPASQSQSRFRYLGKQKINEHTTYVVAFAQIPDRVNFPTEFLYQRRRIPILYQGVAWIDSSDFRIVEMREDLLAPRPDADLKTFTATVRFGEIRISKAGLSLWLPEKTDLEWDFQGRIVRQQHRYSHYRLYSAKTRIIPTAP